MKASKKDFDALAKAVRAGRLPMDACHYDEEHELVNRSLGWVAMALADELESSNKRFDRSKFLMACGANS